MKIKEIMRRPVFIHQDASKKDLLALAKKNKNALIFIIADENKRFLGDIHENDLFLMLLPNESYEDIGVELAFDLEKKFFAVSAKELMRKHDITCYEDEKLMDVALRLAGAEVNEMPVLNKKEEVVGVITEGLLLRHLKIK
ncbi:MAG: CBS domain-containing protein [archaeon]